jgi:hypothetical protein
MSYVKISHDGHELEVTTEAIEITSISNDEPDPDWTETDSQGHRHYRSTTETGGPYPTLQWKPDMVHCSDCHEEEDHGHLVCIQCGERVQPGMRPLPPGRNFIPGMTSYLIDGQPVSKQAAEDFLAAARAERRNA